MYENFDDLLTEYPLACWYLAKANIATKWNEYTKRAERIITDYTHEQKYRLIPTEWSINKLVIRVEGEKADYILAFPRWNRYRNRKSLEERIKNRKMLSENDELVLYEDNEGFEISFLAGVITDWNSLDLVRQVFGILKKVRASDRRISRESKKYTINQDIYIKLDESAKEKYRAIEAEVNRYEDRISHSDAHCANFLMRGGRVFLIDWDDCSMNDPMYDVLFFIADLHFVRKCRLFQHWEEYLALAFSKLEDGRLRHARAVMVRALDRIMRNLKFGGCDVGHLQQAMIREIERFA